MTQLEKNLIDEFKRGFFLKTGKGLLVEIANKKVADPYAIPVGLTEDKLLKFVFEATGWDREYVMCRSFYKRAGNVPKKVTMLILNKGYVPHKKIAQIFGLERSTVSKALNEIKKEIIKDASIHKLVLKIIKHIEENHEKISSKN